MSNSHIRVLRFTDAPGARRISYATVLLDARERDLAGFEDLQLHSMFFELREKLPRSHFTQVCPRLHAAPRLRVGFHRGDHAAARELRPQIRYAEQLFCEVVDGAGVLE